MQCDMAGSCLLARPCSAGCKCLGHVLFAQAAVVADRAELHMYGSAARLNFPAETYADDVQMLAGGPHCQAGQCCMCMSKAMQRVTAVR